MVYGLKFLLFFRLFEFLSDFAGLTWLVRLLCTFTLHFRLRWGVLLDLFTTTEHQHYYNQQVKRINIYSVIKLIRIRRFAVARRWPLTYLRPISYISLCSISWYMYIYLRPGCQLITIETRREATARPQSFKFVPWQKKVCPRWAR